MKLTEIFSKQDISSKYYRFFFVTNYSYFLGVFIHLSFIFLFWQLRIPLMMQYNIISTTIFLIAFIINRKGFHNLGLALILIEILVHAALATHYTGWESGFFVYVMALIPLTFFNPALNHLGKVALALFITAFALALNYYANTHTPLASLPRDILNNLYYVNSFFFYVVLAFLSFYYSHAAKISEEELKRSRDQIDKLARKDPLTQLSNRRDIVEKLDQTVTKCSSADNRGMAIILADIDNFKSFNDEYGHDCGDFVLVTIAQRLQHRIRAGDHIGRWGGEEFIIILTDTNVDEARNIAEMLRLEICNQPIQFEDMMLAVSLTFGLSMCHCEQDIERCITLADKSLYAGKQAGKNQVQSLSS